MTEIAPAAESYVIVTGADRIEAPLRVLKHGESFAVFDQHGDIVPAEAGEQGLYFNDTRFLSRCELTLDGKRPLLLSSSVTDDNTVFTVDLMNPDLNPGESDLIARGQVHVFRSVVLCDGCCYQRIRVSNYGLDRLELPLSIKFEGDFADLFEVRGTRRLMRGERLPIQTNGSSAVLGYRGRDGLERRTRLDWTVAPDRLDNDTATFSLSLKPKATVAIDLTTTCELPSEPPRHAKLPAGHDDAVAETLAQALQWRAAGCHVTSSSDSFNRWLMRSEADLSMMITNTPYGPYPYAGVPWFSTPFGRDGIITALELL